MPATIASDSTPTTTTTNQSRLLRFTGHAYLRQRLILSILSGRPVRIDAIRPDASSPGIRVFEASFLRLLEKVTNGSHVEISYTGTSILLRPGIISGGDIVHDCGTSRAIGYFLEWILVLAPFAKKEFNLTLKGITSKQGDLGVDTLRTVTLPILQLFLPISSLTASTLSSSLELRILKRGAAPLGGGEIQFRCPILPHLSILQFIVPGRIKKIRGIASATRVSPQFANRLIDQAKSILSRYIPDVYLFADVYRGIESGLSPGFSISLLATTTTGSIYSSEFHSSPPSSSSSSSDKEKDDEEIMITPEQVSQKACFQLLHEISLQGCIDRSHLSLVLLFMALSPNDVSKCRLPPLTTNSIQMVRDIQLALGVSFRFSSIDSQQQDDDLDLESSFKQHSQQNEVLVSCIGIHLRGFKKVT